MARTGVPPSTTTWLTSVGVPIRCWRPTAGDAQPLEWWEPFLTICRRAREIHFVWPLWLDEFELIGRVDRAGRPAIWIYRHRRARRELYCDDTGATYRLIPTPRGSSPGQFRRCDLTRALFGAAIHAVVDPHWWKHPEDRRPDADELDRPDWTVPRPRYAHIDAGLDPEPMAAAPKAKTARNGKRPKLHLVAGGRQSDATATNDRSSGLGEGTEGDRPA